MKRTTLPLGFFLAAAAHAAVGASIPNYLPPDTKVVIGIQVRNIAASPVMRNLPAAIASKGAGVNADWTKLMNAAGFDPLKDVDDVILATNAKGQNAPVLVIARGRFENLHLPDGGTPYQGVVIHQGKGQNSALAMLDGSTVLFGDAMRIRRAIDGRNRGSQLDPAVLAILNSLRAQYDVWGYGQVPPGAVPANPQAPGVESIDRFQFGVSLSHGLDVSATLHTRSSADGEKLVAAARLFELMIKSQQPAANAAKVDIHTENETVKIALSVPQEELQKALEMRMNPGSAPAIAPATAERAAPQELVIQRAPNGDTQVVTLPGKK